MADITNDKGSLEQPPSTRDQAPPSPEDKELDREADQSAKRASERIKRIEHDHDMFTG